jgi:predicted nucleotidyltransferase
MSVDQRLHTEEITPELIDYIVEKIVREIQPQKIILFGSYARGDVNQDSDLDLFIITGSREPGRITRRKVEALLWGRRFPMDLIVRNPDEVEWNFRAKNPFYLYHIFKDGKVLYEKEAEEKTEAFVMEKTGLLPESEENGLERQEEKEK